jgi:hypothetical protein
MKRFWTVVLYVLAGVIILGRIGTTLDKGFWLGFMKLYPPLSSQMIGYDIESLGEDLIVFLAVRDFVLLRRARKASTLNTATE